MLAGFTLKLGGIRGVASLPSICLQDSMLLVGFLDSATAHQCSCVDCAVNISAATIGRSSELSSSASTAGSPAFRTYPLFERQR